jgi:hypothetical protein
MSKRDESKRDAVDKAISKAFVDWRDATVDAAPAPELLDAVLRATSAGETSTLSASLWSVGRHVLWVVALAAALLAFAATRSLHTLEDRAAAALAGATP